MSATANDPRDEWAQMVLRSTDTPRLAPRERNPCGLCFNPRSRRAGANDVGSTLVFDEYGFQSTLPRGSERGNADPTNPANQFQSTLPRGSEQ